MRKLIFIVFLFSSISLTAQHKAFQFGFKGAANMGWFGSNVENYNNEGLDFGGSWGFVADIYLMESYSITTGFDVIYLNGTLSYPHAVQDSIDDVILGRMTSSFKTKYIEIPIIFTMKTKEIGKLRYYGQIGFGMGFLLSAKTNDTFTPNDGSTPVEDKGAASGLFKTTRESLIIGAGIEIPLSGSTYIRTGIKYDNAFINVMKGNNRADLTVANDARNSFIELNLCLIF